MTRQFTLTLVGFLLFVSSAVSLFLIHQTEMFELRGYVNAVEDHDLPFRVPRLGINADLLQYTDATLVEQLQMMDRVGIKWVRQFADWSSIEPDPGDFKWEQWDRLINGFEGVSDLQLIVVFVNTPIWARDTPSDLLTSPPTTSSTFARFTSAFSERYGHIVDYYQIWDEPNLRSAWGGRDPQPTAYVDLLASAYNAIRSADPSATVIVAALAPTTETGPENLSEMRYLRQLYEVGAQRYFDAIAGKPYGFSVTPLDRTVDESVLNFSRLVALREIMVEFGDTQKAIWAMNGGWNHLPDWWVGNPSIWGKVSSSEQVRFFVDAITRAEREWPWLAGMLLQHWQPNALPDNPIWGFTVIDSEGQSTPLLNAIQSLNENHAATNGLYDPATSFAKYSGVWSFGPLGADVSWVQGGRAMLMFEGTELALLLRQGNYVAYLYPFIDDLPANAAPQDNLGNAYVTLTSGDHTTKTQLVPVATELNPGYHTLELVVDRGWDQWPLVGYAISSGDLRQSYRSANAVATLGLLLSIVLMISNVSIYSLIHIQRTLARLGRITSESTQWIASGIASVILMFGMLLTWNDSTPAILRRETVHIGLSIITAGLIYVQPGIWIAIVAIAVIWWLIFNRIEIGLVLTVFWSPFFLFPIELYQFAFPLSEIIVLLTFSAWLTRLAFHWSYQIRQGNSFKLNQFTFHSIDWLVAAWLGLGFFAFTWSEYRASALTELRVMFIEPALFYMMLRSMIIHKAVILERCVVALIASGVVVAIIGLAQYMQGQAIITAESGVARMASVYGSPNNLALFLGRCLPFLLAAVFLIKRSAYRGLLISATIIIGIALFLSQSAGALFVGIPVSVTVVILLTFGRRSLYAILIIGLLGVIGSIAALQSPRFSRLLDFADGTNFYRLRVWESAIDIVRDYPITGLGLDQFLYAFRGHYIRPDAWQEPDLSHPHNIVLDVWIRLGLFGVLLLLAMQYSFWRSVRKSLAYQTGDVTGRIITIGGAGCMANLIVHGMVDNSIFVNDLVYVFVLIMAPSAFCGFRNRPENSSNV